MKVLLRIIMISCFSLVLFTSSAHAQQIELSVLILPHKLTDTINDFDFSGLNTSKTSTENQAVTMKKAAHPGFFAQIIKGFNNLWPRIF